MHREFAVIDESTDLIGKQNPDFKFEKILTSKIGRALISHIQKFPDVISAEGASKNHALDLPTREDL